MAKLVTLFFIMVAIQASLLMFAQQTPQTTDLWSFMTNIDNWNSLTFILTLVGIAGAIGLVGIAATSLFGFKTDFLMLAPAIAGLISMGVVFINLANVLRDELVSRVFTDCGVSPAALHACAPVNWILAITIAPLAFFYVWTVMEWWRGKDF